ncbi:putative uncharacterized protein [Clostridium sp. CAG:448]|nr:putative uncharacterized protein [Clostridium sp. CAG:448]
MTLTQKETGLLKDLKGQEQLCIEKYRKYAAEAKSDQLRNLFNNIASVEEKHLTWVTDMMNGKDVATTSEIHADNQNCTAFSYPDEDSRQKDAFFCRDLLATEKHASSLYDVSVFEFTSPTARKTLNRIQSDEQQHGEQLYAYMKANNMYS